MAEAVLDPALGYTAAALEIDTDDQIKMRYMQEFEMCNNYCANGAKQLFNLQRKIESSRGAPWPRKITLGAAVMTGNLSCLRYLVDEVEVESINQSSTKNGFLPLQQAVIWGKIDIMAYLLSRGADPMLDRGEDSVPRMAAVRLKRLQFAFENTGDGAEYEGYNLTRSQIGPLIEANHVMLQVLEGVEVHGSWFAWALRNRRHPLVKRYSWDLLSPEVRYKLCLARFMVLGGRASLKETEQRQALDDKNAKKKCVKEKEDKEEESLTTALVSFGLPSASVKEVRDALQAVTVGDLRAAKYSKQEFEQRLQTVTRLTDTEFRRCVRFMVELQDYHSPAAATGGYAATAKKGSGKVNPALAALAAAGASKPGNKTGAPGTPAAKQKPKRLNHDGMDVLFNPELPENAFMSIVLFSFGIRASY